MTERLVRMLETATVRLEILLGRMRPHPELHAVSLIEAPSWIEEQRDLLRDFPAGSGPQQELEQIRKMVLALCDEPEDEESPYVIVGESGLPIVEAATLPEAVEQIIACWNAVELKLDGLSSGPTPEGERPTVERLTVLQEAAAVLRWYLLHYGNAGGAQDTIRRIEEACGE